MREREELWGRDWSALRPYETYPFHQPALFTPYTVINISSIYKIVPVIPSMYYLQCVLRHCTFAIYACAIPEPVVSRISAILRSFCRLCGTYWYEIQRDTLQRDTDPLQYGVGIVNG